MIEYYWVKLNFSGKQDFVIASKETDSNYFRVIETDRLYYHDMIKDMILINKPVKKFKKSISKEELNEIIDHLKLEGTINNYNGSFYGVVYGMGWYVIKYAKDYGIDESTIKPSSIYFLGDGSWNNKPKLKTKKFVISHIINYCNELIAEHNKISDDEMNITAIWGVN